jgi:hypothetical protein
MDEDGQVDALKGEKCLALFTLSSLFGLWGGQKPANCDASCPSSGASAQIASRAEKRQGIAAFKGRLAGIFTTSTPQDQPRFGPRLIPR